MSPAELTIGELVQALGRNELSVLELVESCLERIDTHHERLHAFLEPMRELSIARAKELDSLPSDKHGPLHGIPVAVKDIISVQGVPCTCGSRFLEHYVPLYDATVIKHLTNAGAIILGKTNLDEFGMGSSTENSAFGPTSNPWSLKHVPGGSSGGSAAAVAARNIPAAIGSDTGGSIRQPAALCGVVGLKPTYGRVSRYGLVAFASSLDQIGPITRTVEDAARLLQVLSGKDLRDSTSSPQFVPNYLKLCRGNVSSLSLGVPKSVENKGVTDDVRDRFREALSIFESLGVTIKEVELETQEDAVATYYLVATAEASANLARFDGVRYGLRHSENKSLDQMYADTRSAGFGPEVKRRIIIGTFVLSSGYYEAYYLRAQKNRTLIRENYRRIFKEVDAVVLPTTPSPAFQLGDKLADPLQMYLNDIFTTTANLTGAPAMSIPAGFARNGLPIGLQLIGKHFDEGKLLQLSAAYETATDHHKKKPPLLTEN